MRPVLVVVIAGWLVGCRSQQPIIIENYAQANKLVAQYVRQYNTRRQVPWQGPLPGAATRLRRRHPGQEAVLWGHVAEVLEKGKEEKLPGISVAVAGKVSASTDATGSYAVMLLPGCYQVRAVGVNFLPSQSPLLQVEPGDSICLNFRLMPELRPFICQ